MRTAHIISAASLALLLITAVSAAQGRRSPQRPSRDANALKVGQMAPTFRLASPDGTQGFTLQEFRGKKPVVLFFGSYT